MKYAFPMLLISIFFSWFLKAQFQPFQNDVSYSVLLDIRSVKEDRLPVTIIPPVISQDTVEFHLPRIIPGTYSIENYGQFVNDLEAFDAEGSSLPVKRLDKNRWEISSARKLYRISYTVDDTYDIETDIFQPAGTTLEDSVFLLNNFGFIGYLKGYKNHPFTLNITKPKGFYGSTSLSGTMGDTLDVFSAKDYFEVHDNPIMYCVPDTAVKRVGGAEVMVSVYSPNKTVNARTAMEGISNVLDASAAYLGGDLPVDKYTVIIYCVSLADAGNSYGALEHHTSTVLYMPEFGGDQFYNGVRDITSHEFFHIVTPLNIHSEYIADFNFIDPVMSEHIWFYEGVTEYNSHLVQIRNGIYDMPEFLDIIREKIITAEQFNEHIPLTLASRFTLDFFKNEYYNFYQKGAIAGMALDLKLRELSSGEYGLVNLLEELENTYGVDTFFRDEDFFDIITDLTYPEMRKFFAGHFEGTAPFPLKELLANAGIEYVESAEEQRISSGNLDLSYNFETGRLLIEGVEDADEFGRALGIKKGDEIIEFNGQKIDINNFREVISDFYTNTRVKDKVVILVARPDGNGGYSEEKLKARAILGTVEIEHSLYPVLNPDADQIKIRKAWINQ